MLCLHSRSAKITLAILLQNACLAAIADAGDWPGFRGAHADGVAAGSGVWSPGQPLSLKIAWKRTLGSGYSGVSVVGDTAVTMFSDGVDDVAVALDARSGKELWRYKIDKTYKGHDGSHDGPIATPLIAAGRVFGLDPRGKLFALDKKSGAELWSTDLVTDHGAKGPHYGFASSPLLLDGVLIVQLGAKDGFVCGFNPADGKRLWAAGNDKLSYQSPIPFTHNDRRYVVAAGDKNLLAVNPADGNVLWQYAHGGAGEHGAACLVPVQAGEGRLFLTHKEDRATLLTLAPDGASAAEIKPLWEQRSFRNSYTVSVYHDGYLYGYKNRIFTRVDAATGKSVWLSRRPGDGFPILVDGHLILVTKSGGVYVARTGTDTYQEIAALDVFEDLIWTPPSFAQGSIFMRSLGEIARINISRDRPSELAQKPSGADIAGSRFARFLDELRSATDKKTAVDRFMSSNSSLPLIEPDGLVHFIYRGPGEDLAIAGDLVGMGNEQPMNRVNDTDLFYYSARLEPDTRLSYVFMRDFKKIIDPRNPRKTVSNFLTEDMEIAFGTAQTQLSVLAMPGWKEPAHLREPDPSRRGRVETHKLKSSLLSAEHTIDVYLPRGYADGDSRYPVAYVHGGALARGAGSLTHSLDNLIGDRVEPLIVVFINRPPPFFGFEKYASMIADELIPFVDEKFRTVRSPVGRANVAAGPGGVAATICTLGHPKLFGKLALQSPWMVDTKAIDPLLKTAAERPLRIYLDWGKYDLRSPLESWSMAEMGRKLDALLRERGYEPAGGETHDGTEWPSWKNRNDAVFEALFPLRRDE